MKVTIINEVEGNAVAILHTLILARDRYDWTLLAWCANNGEIKRPPPCFRLADSVAAQAEAAYQEART